MFKFLLKTATTAVAVVAVAKLWEQFVQPKLEEMLVGYIAAPDPTEDK